MQWKRKEDDSFHNLFGPPSIAEVQKPVENTEETHKIEKSLVKKPLPGKTSTFSNQIIDAIFLLFPVNPLTGDVVGMEPKKETLEKLQQKAQPKPKSGSK